MDIMDNIVNPRVQYLDMDGLAVCECNVTNYHHMNGCKQSSGCNNS